MDTLTLVFVIIIGFLILCLFYLRFLMSRNHKVAAYRISLTPILSKEKFNSMKGYSRMLFSLLPLKDKYWLKK